MPSLIPPAHSRSELQSLREEEAVVRGSEDRACTTAPFAELCASISFCLQRNRKKKQGSNNLQRQTFRQQHRWSRLTHSAFYFNSVLEPHTKRGNIKEEKKKRSLVRRCTVYSRVDARITRTALLATALRLRSHTTRWRSKEEKKQRGGGGAYNGYTNLLYSFTD